MNNFPDCMKSIEKMDAQSNMFTATELCFCLSVSFLYMPYSYLTENRQPQSANYICSS